MILSNCTVLTGWPLTGFSALKQPVATHGHVRKHSSALSGIAEGLLNEHRESLMVLAHLRRRDSLQSLRTLGQHGSLCSYTRAAKGGGMSAVSRQASQPRMPPIARARRCCHLAKD